MALISVLVANAKGGCGKTTIATNLATVFANAGLRTAIADADRQRSCRTWAGLRPESVPEIQVLDWRKSVGETPPGIERLVIDSGAGLRSRHVQELLRRASFLVMPVLPSVFDEKATREFLRRVEELKPVRKGNKPVFVVGNRIRARTRAESELKAFLGDLGHEVAARFQDRSLYQQVARRGLGIFDLPPARRATAVNDWLPLVQRIESHA